MTPNFEISVILSLKLMTNISIRQEISFLDIKIFLLELCIQFHNENTELILPLSLLSNQAQVLVQQNPPMIWKYPSNRFENRLKAAYVELQWLMLGSKEPMVWTKWPLYNCENRARIEFMIFNNAMNRRQNLSGRCVLEFKNMQWNTAGFI